MTRYLLLALTVLAAPAAAQITATLPVTCNAGNSACIQAIPVTNPDGTNIGGGGGSSTRTTAAGTSDTLAVPVQGVTGGVPQNTTVTSSVLPTGGSTSALQTTGNTSLGTIAGTVTAAGSPSANAQTVQVSTPIRGGTSLVTAQVSVGTTATLVVAARSGRSRLVITQAAAGPCYYSSSATVSATTGARMTAAGASKTYQYAGALYGICPSAAVTTDVDEEF